MRRKIEGRRLPTALHAFALAVYEVMDALNLLYPSLPAAAMAEFCESYDLWRHLCYFARALEQYGTRLGMSPGLREPSLWEDEIHRALRSIWDQLAEYASKMRLLPSLEPAAPQGTVTIPGPDGETPTPTPSQPCEEHERVPEIHVNLVCVLPGSGRSASDAEPKLEAQRQHTRPNDTEPIVDISQPESSTAADIEPVPTKKPRQYGFLPNLDRHRRIVAIIERHVPNWRTSAGWRSNSVLKLICRDLDEAEIEVPDSWRVGKPEALGDTRVKTWVEALELAKTGKKLVADQLGTSLNAVRKSELLK
jgi:hypothetical protein